MEVDLPFKAEYAKTGRAGCKGCKSKIDQGALRLAVMVQSAFHDGKQPNWYHEKCLFAKHQPGSVGDIANFENLRFEDQERVKKSIDSCTAVITGNGKKKNGKRSKEELSAVKNYGIEYAKSGRAKCSGCQQTILKDEVRIRKTVYDTEIGMKFGGQALWHHLECFRQLREELGWLDTGENLPGFNILKKEDKAEVRKLLPLFKNGDIPAIKKPKIEKLDKEDEELSNEVLDVIKKQNKRLFKFRDRIKGEMHKNHMIEILENNGQEPVKGDSERLLDQLADLLTFGALYPCPECNGRQLLFQKSGYLCNGQLTEWTKCSNLIRVPQRQSCKIPSNIVSEYSFLKDVKQDTEDRAIRHIPPSAATILKSFPVKKEDEIDGPKVKRERPPLYNMEIALYDVDDENKLKKHITKLGGKYTSKVTEKTTFVLSTSEAVKRMGKRMEKVRSLGLHVVPAEYLEAVESNSSNAVNYISSMSLCDWGTDPAARIKQDVVKSSKSKSIYTKSVPKSMTLKIRGGLAVDPGSGLEDVAHVYVAPNKDKYSVVLGITDIQSNKNSFYKLQLLQSDNKMKYWVFRSWGRIGTTIGGDKLEKFSTLVDAVRLFKDLYLEKSGNHFDNRNNFQKVSGCMYPIDIEYEQDNNKVDLFAEHSVKSKLPQPVQDIIKLLFDVETMKKVMMEFDLDMEKMPLGKLSQKQIQSAYKVLTEIYELMQANGSKAKFIDATNRFYTLIPHDFGVQSPPLLNTNEQVEKLREMLDSLLEIECAYSLIGSENSRDDINPIDKHYKQLKVKLEPLDKKSEEFSLLQQYVKNTHAETHKMYELEIIDIFKVARQGESNRYKPFKKLHNRRLLWHGSRLTNFAGILSHGLKIAPPEAPVTGYMFGKGIYFADMVSKSANYCCTSSQNSTGLMLLSEVALGNMLECTAAKYVTKLPTNNHSCFGQGRTMPDPKESVFREDGVEIPLGKPISNDTINSSLLYNEFIVYDVAQVNIQYLFRMNFKYNLH